MDKAEKLLARMRASKADWGEKDLELLYTGFGFEYRDCGGHRVYSHPRYPWLVATVARHASLAKGFIVKAIRLIEELKSLEAANEGGSSEA